MSKFNKSAKKFGRESFGSLRTTSVFIYYAIFIVILISLISFISTGVAASDSKSNITMVNGDSVQMLENGSYIINNDKATNYIEKRNNNSVYLIPEGFDSSKYDDELFNLTRLSKDGIKGVPAIVSYKSDYSNRFSTTSTSNYYSSLDMSSEVLDGNMFSSDSSFGELSKQSIKKISYDYEVESLSSDSVEEVNAVKARNNYEVTGNGVDVSVIDSGINSSHPYIEENIVYEKDFTNDGTTEDIFNHGTLVSGIIAGEIGVAPNANLYNMRALDSEGSGRLSWIVNAIDESIKQDVDIISMSLGADIKPDNPLNDAVKKATREGIVVIAAAGNMGSGGYSTIAAPANSKYSISVGADNTIDGGEVAGFSSKGPTESGRIEPAITAPGVDVLSTSGDNRKLARSSGTSFAAPHISGVAALIIQNQPRISPKEIKSRLITTADDLGEDIYSSGSGQANANKALGADIQINNPRISYDFNQKNGYDKTKTKSFKVSNIAPVKKNFTVHHNIEEISGDDTANYTVSKEQIKLNQSESKTVNITINSDRNSIQPYGGKIILDGPENNYTVLVGYVQPPDSDKLVEFRKISRNGNPVGFGELTAVDKNGIVYDTEINDSGYGTVIFPNESKEYTVVTHRLAEEDYVYRPIFVFKRIVPEENSGVVYLDEGETVEQKMSIDIDENINVFERFPNIDIGKGYSRSYIIDDFDRVEPKDILTSSLTEEDAKEVEHRVTTVRKYMTGENYEPRERGDTDKIYSFGLTNDKITGPYERNIKQEDLRVYNNTYYRDVYSDDIDNYRIYPVHKPKNYDNLFGLNTDLYLGDRTNQKFITGSNKNFFEAFSYSSDGPINTVIDYKIGKETDYSNIKFNKGYSVPNMHFTEEIIRGNVYPNRLIRSQQNEIQLNIKVNGQEVFDTPIENNFNQNFPREVQDGDEVELEVNSDHEIEKFARYTFNYDEQSLENPPKIQNIKINGQLSHSNEIKSVGLNLTVKTNSDYSNLEVLYPSQGKDLDNPFKNSENWSRSQFNYVGNGKYKGTIYPSQDVKDLALGVDLTDGSKSTQVYTSGEVEYNVSGSFGTLNVEPSDNIEQDVQAKVYKEDETDIYDKINTSINTSRTYETGTYRIEYDDEQFETNFVKIEKGDNININMIEQKNRKRPSPIINENIPRDLNLDGNYEDVNGDGILSIFDVQFLFEYKYKIDSSESSYFDFAGINKKRVSIFDVQSLFYQVT